ncbi:unnamed protein product (macronuclear) [Paramecium tetraurelia]|uniref:Uncharacterized protein n=1 Tax=Paramecium tetraurelia TaxID=5888 RepID=A0BK12_PARTE|nr:uncharacterized protein GSPATT00029509001 [Paramecium tetraurelia]CAK58879.1 unnamed protein product [Paramecium tetraurelia]|eukprot:XP_001426277.1 hypothetical protein (macronuclear) [Paramecium tetraurelia strain d4-2]
MNQSLIQIRQQRRILPNNKKYTKPLPSFGSKRNATLIYDRSVLTNERINKNLRIEKNIFGESSCHCDSCGKRSTLMKKIFQLYQFPQTKYHITLKKQLMEKVKINSPIQKTYPLYRIVKRIKTKKKFTIKKVLTKQTINEQQQQKPSTIQSAILELKQIIRVDSTQQSKRNKPKSKDSKNSYTSLLKGRRNLRQLFFIPQLESPIKQFIIKNSKPNTVHHSPMQSLYDFKISSSFRGL